MSPRGHVLCVGFILKGRKVYQARVLLMEVAEGWRVKERMPKKKKKNKDDAYKILKLSPYSIP